QRGSPRAAQHVQRRRARSPARADDPARLRVRDAPTSYRRSLQHRPQPPLILLACQAKRVEPRDPRHQKGVRAHSIERRDVSLEQRPALLLVKWQYTESRLRLGPHPLAEREIVLQQIQRLVNAIETHGLASIPPPG